MRKKQRNSNRSDVTQQRSAKPDELVMVCENNEPFGRRLIETFKTVKSLQGKANE